MTIIITEAAEETKRIAANLAKEVKKQRLFPPKADQPQAEKHALVVALEGNLGSGKTTFIQGLASGLGVKEKVLSPTFLILKQFPIALKNYKNFYHIDAYRLKNSAEILELGFKDLIKNPENIIIIEWADRIKKLLLKNIFWIKFDNLGGDRRKIIFHTT
ncbi:MAG: tRNA (adenosine(37)-N6)-threonylcarbamoyltransferase complex ATPase subunit type 1 TsaE [Patescibacteria group bacterium]